MILPLKTLSATLCLATFYLYSSESSMAQRLSIADDTQEQIRTAALAFIEAGISTLHLQQTQALEEEKRLQDNAARLRKELDDNSEALLANGQFQIAIRNNIIVLESKRRTYTIEPEEDDFMYVHAGTQSDSTATVHERRNSQDGPQIVPFELRQLLTTISQRLDALREQLRTQAQNAGLVSKP